MPRTPTTRTFTTRSYTAGRSYTAQPGVPASGVAYTNAFGHAATVTVSGGTVSVIAVNGVATGLTSGAIAVPAAATITITYTVLPTWAWTIP